MTVIVAGMVVLDLIPALPADAAGLRFRPGVVVRTGPARIAPGGCVANTGTALHMRITPNTICPALRTYCLVMRKPPSCWAIPFLSIPEGIA